MFTGDDGELRLVFTRRSQRLRSHTGEVAFPGGRRDPGETLVETALREAHEEIKLPPSAVRIIGQLDALSTVRNPSAITPFVGVIDGPLPELIPSPAEVERVFDVALIDLIDPDCYHEEQWPFPDGTYPVHFFDVPGDTIWGATARMLHQLLTRLLPD